MVYKIKKVFTDNRESLEDHIPLVIMEIKTSLLYEANQLFKFNEEIGTCKVSKAGIAPCSKEAVQIMKEANLLVENNLRARFPLTPETPPKRFGVKN